MAVFKWWNNEGWNAQIVEAVIQTIFWYFALNAFSKWLKKLVEDKSWFQRRPGRKDRIISFITRIISLPQHFLRYVRLF